MAATHVVTKSLDRMVAIATAISGIGSSRISQGYKRWTDAQNLEELVKALTPQTQGYCWLALHKYQKGVEVPARVWVKGELLVSIAKETSSDLTAAWEFALSLVDALTNRANYQSGEYWPETLDLSLATVEIVEAGGIAVFEFGSGEGQCTLLVNEGI